MKLFRNHPEARFQFRIHEQILPALRAIGGRIARIDQPVLHQNYDVSEQGQKRKRARDWPLLAKDLEENPEHPFVLFNCGMTAHYTAREGEAIQYLERCIERSVNGESHLRKAYALLGMTHAVLKDYDRALTTFLKGLKAVGEDPELRFHAAKTLQALGRAEEAAEMYLAVKPDDGEHFSSMDIGIVGYKRSFNLGALYLGLGRYAEGR